jgi:phospholipase B1
LQDAHSAANYANNIKAAIQILYDALPRVIVSITGMFQMQMLRQVDAGQGLCSLLHV